MSSNNNVSAKQASVDDQSFTAENWTDADGNHQGGQSYGPGFAIAWQRGPIPGLFANNQNGALIITVLRAVIHQVEYFQNSKFACAENAVALEGLNQALEALQSRKRKRAGEKKLETTKV